VLLTAGFTSTLNVNPTSGPMVSLPLAAFELVRSPQPTQIARGFATAATLMVLVLVLFTIARVLGGRPAGHQSKRQAKSTRAASAADLERMTQRTALRQLAANGSADAGTSSGDPATEFDLIAEVLR
jgi:phosphate transport system permease protein